ncbi:MAG: tRNA (guanosine(37)-N1)-methyltransferase TrmD, partial [Saprospiraceae bacterium]|nr:tRNA (guanosine(37)-N1)-methyltransferase TrmD [Saprospiraceae bacterium]
MHIDILSAVPDLLESPFGHSILHRAQERALLEVNVFDLRAFGLGKHRQIDDYQYGGGAGMVMMAEPLANAIESLREEHAYDEIIYLTPDGSTLDQSLVNQLSLRKSLLLICGHYKGIDERIRELYVTMEISIGDYVLSGGELPAAVLVDAIGRILPGVIGDGTSALEDSFQDGILAPP